MKNNSQCASLDELPLVYNIAEDLLGANIDAGRSDKIAYIDRYGEWTYGALFDRVKRMGSVLHELGVQREQRVLVCVHDTVDFPTVFLGAIRAGIVPVAVNTLFNAETYEFQLKDSRAKIAFISEAVKDCFADALQKCPELEAVIVVGPDGDAHLEKMLASAAPVAEAAATSRDEAAFWLYTSGSTGNPKGVVHSHAAMRLTADLYGQPVARFQEADVVHSVAKLYFAYGLGNGLTFPLSVGATTVLNDGRPTPDVCSQILKKHRVSVLCGSPTFFAAMLAHPDCPTKTEAPALRVATSAGEALPAPLAERFYERFGVSILDGLGSTEMLHIFISQEPDAPKFGVTGKPVPGYECRIVDESGKVAEPGVIGELHVKGPSAALCYWNNRPKSIQTFQGDWTRTGDKYVVDAQGYYRYAGRSDDMLKVSGIYVSPFDVEEALISHPAVLEAAVVGWIGSDGLLKPKAFVIRAAGVDLADTELEVVLREHVKSRVARHAYPRWFEFVTELPKTSNGKIQRFKLKQEAAKQPMTRP